MYHPTPLRRGTLGRVAHTQSRRTRHIFRIYICCSSGINITRKHPFVNPLNKESYSHLVKNFLTTWPKSGSRIDAKCKGFLSPNIIVNVPYNNNANNYKDNHSALINCNSFSASSRVNHPLTSSPHPRGSHIWPLEPNTPSS